MRPYESTNYPLAPIYSVARIQLGKMLQPEPRTSADTPIRYLRSASVRDGYIDYSHATNMWASPSEAAGLRIHDRDLLVSEGGDVGRVAMVTGQPIEPTIFQNSVLRVDANQRNDARFLFYALQGLYKEHDYYEVICSGSTIRHLTAEKLAVLRVPSPPLVVQRRVADFLDAQVTLLDRGIQLRQQQTVLLDEQYEARREALIEGNRHAVRTPLGLLVESARPINYGVLMPGPPLEKGIPLIEAGDVMRGPIEISKLRLTDPNIEREFQRSRLRPGDLVMAIRGSVGRTQVVPDGPDLMNVTRDAARISVNVRVALAEYVRHALATRYSRDWLNLRLAGSAVKGINIGDLRKVPVSVLTISAQAEVAARLRLAEQRLSDAQGLLANSISLLGERKQALITAAVSGDFDVSAARAVSV